MRYAGHGIDHLVADRGDQSRGGARLRIVDGGRAERYLCLTHVVGRHAPSTRCEHRRDARRDGVVELESDAHHLGNRLSRDVVLRRAEPTAHDHGIAATERDLECRDDAGVVVTDLGLEMRIDAGQRQLLADPRRVGVDDLPEQELCTDGNHLATHGGASYRP